jgi:hypothetical protein
VPIKKSPGNRGGFCTRQANRANSLVTEAGPLSRPWTSAAVAVIRALADVPGNFAETGLTGLLISRERSGVGQMGAQRRAISLTTGGRTRYPHTPHFPRSSPRTTRSGSHPPADPTSAATSSLRSAAAIHSQQARDAWLSVEQLTTRDAGSAAGHRDPARLCLLQAIARSTTGQPSIPSVLAL